VVGATVLSAVVLGLTHAGIPPLTPFKRVFDPLLPKPDRAGPRPATAASRARGGRRGVVRSCPLETDLDCCEWHASGTAGEVDVAHGGATAPQLIGG
jgi:hypothetical protein